MRIVSQMAHWRLEEGEEGLKVSDLNREGFASKVAVTY